MQWSNAPLNNKVVLENIKANALVALKDVEDKYDIDFNFGIMNYDQGGDFFHVKLNGIKRGAESPSLRTWREDAHLFDCRPEWCERVVDGQQIIGLNHNARKYPILVKHLKTGKTRKHTVANIIRQWSNPTSSRQT